MCRERRQGTTVWRSAAWTSHGDGKGGSSETIETKAVDVIGDSGEGEAMGDGRKAR